MIKIIMTDIEPDLEKVRLVHEQEKFRAAKRRKETYRHCRRRVAQAAAIGVRPDLLEQEMAKLGRNRNHARWVADRIDWMRGDASGLRDWRNNQSAMEQVKALSLREFLNELIDESESVAETESVAPPWERPWETVEKDGYVAVVHTADYGLGWSTGHLDGKARWLAMSRDVVEAVQNSNLTVARAMLANMGIAASEKLVRSLRVSWVPKGVRFRIREYDGKEFIELLDPDQYWQA